VHRSSLRHLILIVLLAALLPAQGARRAAGLQEITSEDVLRHIRYLASDQLQGRGAGTRGCERAAAYIASHFKSWGLKPAGDKGYYQWFSFDAGVKLGSKNRLEIRRDSKRERFAVGRDFTPLGFSADGKTDGEVVFIGYGISAPNMHYDDYAGVEVKDKIALILRYTPDGDDPHSPFMDYAPLRRKVMAAREKGARAVLLVTGPATDAQDSLPRMASDAAFAGSGIAAVAIKRNVAEALFKAAGKDLMAIQKEIDARKAPNSFSLSGARVHLECDVERERRRTTNVLGLLEGSDPALKNEVIIIGAHYDHLGLGNENSRDKNPYGKIHHGADDNASGTAGVLALAGYFAAHRDRIGRSLLFIAFSGEELGLLGSSYYVKHPAIPLEKTAAMINMDMIGRKKNNSLIVLGTGSSPVWKELLQAANKPLGFGLKESSSGFGASDQQSFYTKDIPVLFFFTGLHEDYHMPSDTWDKINAEGEVRVLQLVQSMVSQLASLPARPVFVKGIPEPQMGAVARSGVYLGTVPDYAEDVTGVKLSGVREGSPAEKGGLKGGDIIIRFAGKEIKNIYDYTYALAEAKAGQPVEMVVLRDGKQVTLTVIPAQRRE